MRSRLATLIALCFGAAISTPDVGLMVHRHAGGDQFHVHADLEDGPHPHHHDDEDHDHRHPAYDHDHLEYHHHDEAGHHHHHELGDDDGPGLSAADPAWTWHSHATRPFHRAVASQTTRVPPPRAVTRLAPAALFQRLAAAAIPGRSRGPPPLRSS